MQMSNQTLDGLDFVPDDGGFHDSSDCIALTTGGAWSPPHKKPKLEPMCLEDGEIPDSDGESKANCLMEARLSMSKDAPHITDSTLTAKSCKELVKSEDKISWCGNQDSNTSQHLKNPTSAAMSSNSDSLVPDSDEINEGVSDSVGFSAMDGDVDLAPSAGDLDPSGLCPEDFDILDDVESDGGEGFQDGADESGDSDDMSLDEDEIHAMLEEGIQTGSSRQNIQKEGQDSQQDQDTEDNAPTTREKVVLVGGYHPKSPVYNVILTYFTTWTLLKGLYNHSVLDFFWRRNYKTIAICCHQFLCA